MKGKLIIGLTLTLTLITSLVGISLTQSDSGVTVRKISEDYHIYMNFTGGVYDESGKKVSGLDPFASDASSLLCTTRSATKAFWRYGNGIYVYNKSLTNGKVVASFKVQPDSSGSIQLWFADMVDNWYEAWYYTGLDPSSVYKVTFSWDYPSISGSGYVSSIVGSPFWIPWKGTNYDRSDIVYYKYFVMFDNGTILQISNPFSTTVSKNSEWLNVTLVLDMPSKFGVGTKPLAVYVVAAGDEYTTSPVETINGQTYPLVMKIVFTSGYTVGEDDTVSITYHIHLVEG